MKETRTETAKKIADYRIREMRERDVAPIAKIEKRCFASDPWTADMLRLAAVHESTIFLVADVALPDDPSLYTVGAYAVVRTVAGEGSIDNVCVDAPYRGHGIARDLLTVGMRLARERYDAISFTLEARVSNEAARALYESLGFVMEGVRPDYYEKPREDAAIYWMRS